MSTHTDYLTATVKGSLYASAKRANIPYKLIKQMTDIFNWEMDFIKDIRSGDRFTILYEAFYIEDKLVSIGDIIAVSYNNNGKKHQAIRHIDQSGDTEYFTPEGTSLKKAFSRYPVKFSHISSTYSLSRYHPILHYRRPHKGVDLAAPIGTPIYATGDGRVEQIERDSAYGNMVKVSHNKMYASLYAHLLKFQKGLSRGDRVKRGQIIGYVGQTGLADGPHCHYEFHVNHQPKNPSTIALPRSSPIGRREMPSFKAKAATLFAQLKLFEEAHLIASVKKSTKTA
jgi:murein DD-endopeptidase MepM/ murein hydrolase activator NlpD